MYPSVGEIKLIASETTGMSNKERAGHYNFGKNSRNKWWSHSFGFGNGRLATENVTDRTIPVTN